MLSHQAKKMKEVVQHQGWLLKRGEGYDEDEIASSIGTLLSPTANIRRPSAAAKQNRKEKSTKAQSPITDTDAVFNTLLGNFLARGKGEKKRYFKLVTLEEQLNNNTSSSGFKDSMPRMASSFVRSSVRTSEIADQHVELRYYADASAEVLKGVIPITSDCNLISNADDASFILQTPGRKYYLRPMGTVTEVSSRTTAFQWTDAIKREIRKLFQLRQLKKQYENMSKTASMQSLLPQTHSSSNINTPRTVRFRMETAVFVEPEVTIPQNLGEILANEKVRNEFHEFLVSALAVENLLFYEAVEKATTPEDFAKIVNVFVKSGSEHEVNLAGHQRTFLVELKRPLTAEDFEDAKQEIFRLMEANFFKRFHREAVDKTGAFAALYATLGLDGFTVVFAHFGPVKTDLERLLFTMKSKLKRAEEVSGRIKKEIASSSREVAVREQTTSRRALVAIYHATMIRLDALSDFLDSMATEVVLPLEALVRKLESDLKTIYKSVETEVSDLENCKKMIQKDPEMEDALEKLESAYTQQMEGAMGKLESLELYRIETSREIMLYAVMAEKNLMSDLAKATELFAVACKTIEMEKDIKEFVLIMGSELQTRIS